MYTARRQIELRRRASRDAVLYPPCEGPSLFDAEEPERALMANTGCELANGNSRRLDNPTQRSVSPDS